MIALAAAVCGAAAALPQPVARGRPAGGGFLSAGPIGAYYANDALQGAPAFLRRDVRIDFDWSARPGGSLTPRFSGVRRERFSVRWRGQLTAAFDEPYTFRAVADDGVRLRIRPAGAPEWTSLIDRWSEPGAWSAEARLAAGKTYDVEVDYRQSGGEACMQLLWSSPSTPLEVIDPVAAIGVYAGLPRELADAFADLVRGGAGHWEQSGPFDAQGWPLGDGAWSFDPPPPGGIADPEVRGRLTFELRGQAQISVEGGSRLVSRRDPRRGVVAGSFTAAGPFTLRFRDARRGDGRPGISGLRIFPATADGSTFTAGFEEAASSYTLLRFQLIASSEREFRDRPLPSWFDQAHATAWETKVMLANETGRDLMLSVPTMASDGYLRSLALLLRYGSDGAAPYGQEAPDPVYPPLNPNLRIYLELENELWNAAPPFRADMDNLDAMVRSDLAARDADAAAFDYDHLRAPAAIPVWRYRKAMLRLRAMARIFAEVFGESALFRRIRPVYTWQYDNVNDTAAIALFFGERRLDAPLGSWLWGGGGAAYYGSGNPDGVVQQLTDWTLSGGASRAAGPQQAPVMVLPGRSRISAGFTLPAGERSPLHAIGFRTAASRGAQATLRVSIDGRDATVATISNPDGIRPPKFAADHPWMAHIVPWAWSRMYASDTFSGPPGSAHSVIVSSDGPPTDAAMIERVVLCSADALFAGGMPAAGNATGQDPARDFERLLQDEARWARAFGLETLAYEGGWSVGGDDGGSPLQQQAKYRDLRAQQAQETAFEMFQRAGGALMVMGTYPQWPRWGSPFRGPRAGEFPLVRAVAARLARLPAPARGVEIPARLGPDRAALLRTGRLSRLDRLLLRIRPGAGALLRGEESFVAWDIAAPRAGRWRVTIETGDPAAVEVRVDGAPAPESVFLGAGVHSVRVQNRTPGAVRVRAIEVNPAG